MVEAAPVVEDVEVEHYALSTVAYTAEAGNHTEDVDIPPVPSAGGLARASEGEEGVATGLEVELDTQLAVESNIEDSETRVGTTSSDAGNKRFRNLT